MATATKIDLDTNVHPNFYASLNEDSAKTTSELLQKNHDNHHIFFNASGFHNHIVHHLLTIYALGATPAELQKAYDHNASYQRSPVQSDEKVELHDPATWKKCLNKERHYYDFLLFFQDEITRKGWGNVVNEYLFSGSELAEDLLIRLFAGFLHPLIHLGFGMEFKQPSIVAEALAQTACHDRWIGNLLVAAEEQMKNKGISKMEKSIFQLLEAINGNEKLKNSPHWKDSNKVRDGVLQRAPEEMLDIASQVVVQEDELEAKMVEMMNAVVYYTASSQHPPKSVKMDFYFMHCVNASIFFPTFLGSGSPLSIKAKVRLLEWKIRMDIGMYASRRAPTLRVKEITDYQPKESSDWKALFRRINSFSDDGHASKLLRTIAGTQKISEEYGRGVDLRAMDDMWLKIGHMVVDSVEGYGGEDEPTWGRSVGFEEAWEKVPDRPLAVL